MEGRKEKKKKRRRRKRKKKREHYSSPFVSEMTTIAKPGKDATRNENYRPIFLMYMM